MVTSGDSFPWPHNTCKYMLVVTQDRMGRMDATWGTPDSDPSAVDRGTHTPTTYPDPIPLNYHHHHHHQHQPAKQGLIDSSAVCWMLPHAHGQITAVLKDDGVSEMDNNNDGKRMDKVPYEANDLEGQWQEVLVAMVQRQIKRWLYHNTKRQFMGKTNMGIMRSVLLNKAFEFTKQQLAIPAPRMGQGSGQDSESHPHLTPTSTSTGNRNRNGNGNKGTGEIAHHVHTPPPVQGEPLSSLASSSLSLGSPTDIGWGYFDFSNRSGISVSVPPELDEDVLMKVYGSFVCPNEEIELKALFIQLTQASTHQLVKQLHIKVGDIKNTMEILYSTPEAPEYVQRLIAAMPDTNMLQHSHSHGHIQQQGRQAGSRCAPSTVIAAMAANTRPIICHCPTGTREWRLSNGVVSSWQFAMEFSKKHSGMPSPVTQLIVGGHSCKHHIRIKKSEVQQVLSIGSSWMSDVQHAMMLLCKFGEGRTSLCQDVIATCMFTTEDDRMGACALLEYLMGQGD
ncbi:hypothetical protein HD554DRAFT_2034360 [Boletus coccyginus]|nr:hypothetical protein HD554DRAFT_2034360 [Boletus coccyginus]